MKTFTYRWTTNNREYTGTKDCDNEEALREYVKRIGGEVIEIISERESEKKATAAPAIIHEEAVQEWAPPEKRVVIKRVDPNKRVCATLTDFLLLTSVNFLLVALFPSMAMVMIISLSGFLLFAFRDSYKGQSPGKMFVGLKVVDMNGNAVSYAASFKRNIMLCWQNLLYPFFLSTTSAEAGNIHASLFISIGIISSLIYVIEYFTGAYSKDRRRLGDRLADTKVIDLKPQSSGWSYFFLSVVILIVLYFIGKMLGQYFRNFSDVPSRIQL